MERAVSKAVREASDWIGRTLAAMLAIALPGLAGHWLDGYLGTKFITPVGIIGGMVLATTSLIMLLQAKLPVTPPTRKPASMASGRDKSTAGLAEDLQDDEQLDK